MYDSLKDTYEHIQNVRKHGLKVLIDWIFRMDTHDQSKTEEPEKSMYDEFTPILKTLEYGTEEYNQTKAKMGDALLHHYQVNRHHPEYFQDSLDGMNLLDMLEMLTDWKAATSRMKSGTGDLKKSIEINAERFHMDEKIKLLLLNTASYLEWI
jgi:hypothetical protein